VTSVETPASPASAHEWQEGLDHDGLLAFVLDGAERADRLRRDGASVVYLTGSEIAMFTNGFLPGRDLADRVALFTDPLRMREEVPAATIRVLGSVLAGYLLLPGRGFTATAGYAPLSLTHGPTMRGAAGSVLYLVLIGLLSLGVATLVRDSATAIDALPLSPWAGLGVLAAWAGAALVAGGGALVLRDA
jgi:hypothetical protein